jgi:hypothetical protein
LPQRGQTHDPFRRSLLARAVWLRLLAALAILSLFWLAVAWAVAVP